MRRPRSPLRGNSSARSPDRTGQQWRQRRGGLPRHRVAGRATATINGTPPATTATVTGLTNGTSYTFTVQATNGVGTGPPSAASNAVIPATVPNAPTAVTATRGNTTASVTWTAPANNGCAVTSYSVTASPGGATASGTTAPIVVTGLTNGTSYTFTVSASNCVGTGATSAPSNAVTPATVPGTPTAVTATGQHVGLGHLDRTGQQWRQRRGGLPRHRFTWWAATTVSGAPPATTADGHRVDERHELHLHGPGDERRGHGTAVGCVQTIIPATVPNADRPSLRLTRSNTTASVTWTAPANNGCAVTLLQRDRLARRRIWPAARPPQSSSPD